MMMKKTLFYVSLVFFLLLMAPRSFSQKAGNENEVEKIDRLMHLCKLWGHVKYFHPFLAYRKEIDWDKALVETIPRVMEAENEGQYLRALQSMLERLDDPLTKIADRSSSNNESAENKSLDFQLTEDKILIITIGDYFALTGSESGEKLREINKRLPDARAIVFDLRSDVPVGDYGNAIFNIYFEPIERTISAETLSTAGQRRRVYYGYENFSASASGQYKTGFLTETGGRLIPLKNARNIPSIFVLNQNAGLLKSLPALQTAGKALLVFEDKSVSAAQTYSLPVSDDKLTVARIRVSEPIFADGTDADLWPDLIAEENPLESALQLARNFKPSSVKHKKLPATTESSRENSYPEMKYPSVEYRLLAAFRFWNVIRHFYPYKDLFDEDWEEVLREFIPKFERAKDELEYTLTVAEMVARIEDSHAYINSPVYNRYAGTGYPPIRVRLIEDKPVVTALTDEKAARATGIEVGDLIEKIDGEDASARLARYSRYISASTAQSKMDKATFSFMNGPPDSILSLTLRGRDNREKQVELTRKYEDYTTLYHRERTGEIVKILPGNIGYADLDRLTLDMLDEMFEKLKDTKAIIFDMRGYPNGVAWAIASRLTEKEPNAALFETPLVGHNLPEDSGFAGFFQKIQPTPPGKWIYRGKTIMLIDERAASQAEHTGMLLRAANGTKFVGSRTTGVNGEITTLTLPGAITVGFTGQAVKFPDGAQLQKIGLVPDVEVQPTIKGIRENRDEILEKAVQFVNQ